MYKAKYRKKKTVKIKLAMAIALLVLLVILVLFLLAMRQGQNNPVSNPTGTVGAPWELGGKSPKDYSWEEYLALGDQYKDAFFESFATADDFDKWMTAVKPETPEETTQQKLPWEAGGKMPGEYTWEEYLALDDQFKDAFFESFATTDAFDKWMTAATGEIPEETTQPKWPWETGGKAPREYTWEEYLALDDMAKDAFFESFATTDDFDKWMSAVQPEAPSETTAPPKDTTPPETTVPPKDTTPPETTAPPKDTTPPADPGNKYPWENGGKQPMDYTWEEFESLTSEQQEAFYESFSSDTEFEAWLDKVNSAGTKDPEVQVTPPGNKHPSEYTWEEYEALSGEQKDLFFESFESAEAFDRWMNAMNPALKDTTPVEPSKGKNPWETGGKQPNEYTWEEFLALSEEQQESFFESFASPEAFEAWMQRVQP